MAFEVFANNGQSTLAVAITSTSATTLQVTSAVFFPTTGNFRIVIDSEIMLVTSVSSNTFTVTRGIEGTTKATHLILAPVSQVMTTGGLNQMFTDNCGYGTAADLPAAAKTGRFYYSTDTNALNFDTGSTWETYDLSSATAPVDPSIVQGRLTLTTGVPVTTADVTGATSIYFTPYRGNQIALYNGSAWIVDTFTVITIALGTLGDATKPYDLFAYDNSGSVAFDSPLVWTSTTARATGLVLQNGVLVKNGDATRRYIGTFFPTATTTTEDSLAKRYLWNYYNRVPRFASVFEATASWSYGTATWRSQCFNREQHQPCYRVLRRHCEGCNSMCCIC